MKQPPIQSTHVDDTVQAIARLRADLKDYIHGGCVADWWGFTWMILAEARGVLTPEKRFAAWCRHGERTWWAR
jgi:hypothetical protein